MPCPRCRNEGMQVVLPIAPIARARYQRRMTQTNDRILQVYSFHYKMKFFRIVSTLDAYSETMQS